MFEIASVGTKTQWGHYNGFLVDVKDLKLVVTPIHTLWNDFQEF